MHGVCVGCGFDAVGGALKHRVCRASYGLSVLQVRSRMHKLMHGAGSFSLCAETAVARRKDGRSLYTARILWLSEKGFQRLAPTKMQVCQFSNVCVRRNGRARKKATGRCFHVPVKGRAFVALRERNPEIGNRKGAVFLCTQNRKSAEDFYGIQFGYRRISGSIGGLWPV